MADCHGGEAEARTPRRAARAVTAGNLHDVWVHPVMLLLDCAVLP